MHSAGDLVICLIDYNGHVGWHIDGFNGIHEGYGVDQINLEGIMLEFCQGKELCVKYIVYERGKEAGNFQNGRK